MILQKAQNQKKVYQKIQSINQNSYKKIKILTIIKVINRKSNIIKLKKFHKL